MTQYLVELRGESREVPDSNLDGAFVVQPPPTLGDKLRATFGKALADFVWGPVW